MVRGGLRIDRNTATEANDIVAIERQSPLDRLSWDTMRLLLALADAGSFRSAAMTAGVSLNTIRSKIDRLERQFSTPLLHRSVEGVTPTQAGAELVAIARAMAALGRSTSRVREPDGSERQQSVRIEADGGLGALWLISHLRDRMAGQDAPTIDLGDGPDDAVLFRDIDATVGVNRPMGPGITVERLGSLHIVPFASKAYLEAEGTPATLKDLSAHQLVLHGRDRISADALAQVLDPQVVQTRSVLRTASDTAHFEAVANGLGIGSLPSYAAALNPNLCSLDLGVHVRRDIFLTYHDAPSSDVEAALTTVRAAFEKSRFPCFADTFVHPDEFVDRTAAMKA